MRLTLLPILALLLPLALGAEVTTEYTIQNDCGRKTQRGDSISVHYRGTLASDGSEFDASYNRGKPLDFTVGKGQVIKGWDEGLLDMCIGDKRTLTIPPEFGYGERAMGPIPAGSTLIFETELMGIEGVTKDEL
ncbi:MAG: Peptidyl-prolyl cis-trans isomerase fpr2 [Alectoria sarmentosa]|nr:MAG: Peptidyl-prolyl cis-trans isomerase fpr2 [Alectoria sarmentosa]